jgi:hypothetical protein
MEENYLPGVCRGTSTFFCLLSFAFVLFIMKRFIIIFAILITILSSGLQAADTLHIAPCDFVATNIFGEMISLSSEAAVLRRYVNNKLTDTYQSDQRSDQPLLQDPGQPVFDGADRIYLLDMANNTVIGWDRFLNIYSVTDLDDDLISTSAFTVTSEHDWLIYDDFYGQILQILPGEHFHTTWGDKPVSGSIELMTYHDLVIVHQIDPAILRIADVNGTTLKEYDLPQDIDIERLFPLSEKSFALTGSSGVFIWKPQDQSLRYLSDMKNTVYCQKIKNAYRCISREGVVITIP